MNSKVKEDLESLSKDVYLESPDLWIDFLDKINDEIIDEMVLFFATKYGYLSIVQYAIDNNILDIESKSKNNSFKDIYEHLLHTAKQSNSYKIYDFLVNLNNNYDQVLTSDEHISINTDLPTFICENCKSNIFECGYIVLENKVYKFSKEQRKPLEVSSTLLDSVKCCNCNSIVSKATPKTLEALCNITKCSKCNHDLRDVGIKDNEKLVYDKDSNTFISKGNHYTCHECNTPLNKDQKIHFNLI